jgi:hypothetical protein
MTMDEKATEENATAQKATDGIPTTPSSQGASR